MSKRKMAAFKLRKGETLLKKGLMDYCVTGGYGHAAMGESYLTDERFFFSADLKSGEYLTVEIPLSEINAVGRMGVPLLTRSLYVIADGRQYRFNVFLIFRWLCAIKKALRAMQTKQA